MQARARREAPRGVRVPSPPRRTISPPGERPATDRPELRLALARGALAIELDAPFEIGPFRVEEATVALPVLRFPVDLSGGVSRFRHQRGELDHLVLALHAARLEKLASQRWRGLLGGDGATPEVTIAPFLGGGVFGIDAPGRALAFDVHVAPFDGGVRLLVDRARGLGLSAPPQGLALRALSSLVGEVGRVESGVLLIDDVAGHVLRQLLPLGGARLPSMRGLRAMLAAPPDTGWALLRVERDAAPAVLEPHTLRLLELAELVGEADDAAGAGDLERARVQYFAGLERAPRHPEIGRRIAALDLAVGGRPEAALATLVEATPALDAGVLGAELLAAIGDAGGAYSAFARAGAEEPWSRLAALAWVEAARRAPDRASRAHALDEALARAPLLEEARWERIEARIALGDLDQVRADAELFEAGRRGPAARRLAASRVGRALLGAGYAVEATHWFERALRHAPDDVEAVLGLARSLRDAGKPRRALDLFARAVSLAERRREVPSAALLELAKELVATAQDRPAAIARAAAVPREAPEAPEARALEARWRLELGDRSGAAIAAARVADVLELAIEAGRLTPETATEAQAPERARAVQAASIAREVAALIEAELGVPDLARRLFALAVRAAPRDRRAATELRRLAREAVPSAERAPALAEPAVSEQLAERGSDPAPPSAPQPERAVALEATPSAEADEALVDRLTDKLRADPSDQATAMRLAGALERLGRDMELLALVSARLEEGGDEARVELEPVRRACLGRLAAEARRSGRPDEAALYESLAGDPG